MTGCWTAKCLKRVSHNIQSAGQKGLYYCNKNYKVCTQKTASVWEGLQQNNEFRIAAKEL